MPKISLPNQVCTVIVTVDAAPDVIREMESHARRGLSLFADFNGFVSGALHKSADGGRLVQYLQWTTEAEHLACMNDPRWDNYPSTARFMELVKSGLARMDVRTYSILAISDVPGET